MLLMPIELLSNGHEALESGIDWWMIKGDCWISLIHKTP